jgi:hypothetical protein
VYEYIDSTHNNGPMNEDVHSYVLTNEPCMKTYLITHLLTTIIEDIYSYLLTNNPCVKTYLITYLLTAHARRQVSTCLVPAMHEHIHTYIHTYVYVVT